MAVSWSTPKSGSLDADWVFFEVYSISRGKGLLGRLVFSVISGMQVSSSNRSESGSSHSKRIITGQTSKDTLLQPPCK